MLHMRSAHENSRERAVSRCTVSALVMHLRHLEHFPSALNRGDSQPLSPRRIWGKLIRLGS